MFTSGTELTTALTDALIALLSIYIFIRFLYLRFDNKYMRYTWLFFFVFMFIAGTMGFIIHGITLNINVINSLWNVLLFIFCIILCLLLLTSVIEIKNNNINKKNVIMLSCISLSIFIIIYVLSLYGFDIVLLYSLFVGVSVIYSLSVYFILYFKHKEKNNIYFIISILLQFIGGIVLTSKSFYIKLFLEYDYNSFYHVCLLFTLYLFYLGNKKRINVTF